MGALSDWVKANAKDGADISEAEKLIQASTVDGITSKEQAYDFMTKNTVFKSGLDYATSAAIKSHDDKFMADKLPGLIDAERDKIKAELNPPQTDEQKQIAEMQKRIDAMQAEKVKSDLSKELRAKAKELGFPEERAEHYAIYGDNAVSQMESAAEYWKGQVSSQVEAKLKEAYGNNPPP